MNLSRNIIYCDYHSTTPTDDRVADHILQAMQVNIGNASSLDHEYGDRAESAVKKAQKQISSLIQATPKNIVFTSGATESINLAIQGTVKHLHKMGIKPCIAISAVEHKAVLDTCQILESEDQINLTILPVDKEANVNLSQVEQVCAAKLHLLCIMAANNEVGTLYPIQKISAIAQKYNVPFLCDATQGVGKIPIYFNDWGITMLALSAHKFYGPKGVGALVVREGYPLEPIIYGGGHQNRLRSGTLNVPGIVGLGEACHLRQMEMETDEQAIVQKRDRLQSLLIQDIPGLVVNGNQSSHLAGNLHISVPGIPNSAVIARVRHKLAISTGSACSSGVETPSHVLQAMNLSTDHIEGSLRIGLGKFTTDEEIDQCAEILIDAISKIRELI